MKKSCRLLVFLMLIFRAAYAQQSGFFDVKGKEIIGPDGRPFLIKGINLGNWLVPEGYMFKFKHSSSPRLIDETFSQLLGPSRTADFWQNYLDHYISLDDISYIKKTGANSIRIPFHYKLFTSETYLGSNDSTRGFRLLDRVISWCRELNLYVILDMHCAPGGQTGDNIDDSYGYPFLFENPEDQQLCISIWEKIALHYKDEPTIIGYDLLNEPIAHYFDKDKLNPHLEPLYKRMISAIRKIDSQHIVFLGGAQWNSNFKVFGAPFDRKSVYTFHKYWTDTTQDVIQEYLDFQEKYQVPLYVGESGENKDEWINAFTQLLEKHNIGWHFWPYKKMESSSCMMSFPMPEGYQQVIDFANAKRESFADIREAAKAIDRDQLKDVFSALINSAQFRNAKENPGYVKALNLKSYK